MFGASSLQWGGLLRPSLASDGFVGSADGIVFTAVASDDISRTGEIRALLLPSMKVVWRGSTTIQRVRAVPAVQWAPRIYQHSKCWDPLTFTTMDRANRIHNLKPAASGARENKTPEVMNPPSESYLSKQASQVQTQDLDPSRIDAKLDSGSGQGRMAAHFAPEGILPDFDPASCWVRVATASELNAELYCVDACALQAESERASETGTGAAVPGGRPTPRKSTCGAPMPMHGAIMHFAIPAPVLPQRVVLIPGLGDSSRCPDTVVFRNETDGAAGIIVALSALDYGPYSHSGGTSNTSAAVVSVNFTGLSIDWLTALGNSRSYAVEVSSLVP